jgi:hypothetical protein
MPGLQGYLLQLLLGRSHLPFDNIHSCDAAITCSSKHLWPKIRVSLLDLTALQMVALKEKIERAVLHERGEYVGDGGNVYVTRTNGTQAAVRLQRWARWEARRCLQRGETDPNTTAPAVQIGAERDFQVFI